MRTTTVPPQPPLLEQPHRNHGLFSDHYLNVTLPQRSDWLTLREQAQPVMEQLSEIVASYTPSSNEAQTEHDLVRPIFEALGHTFEVQAPLSTPNGTKRPDYVFYRDETALVANKGKVMDQGLLQGAAFAVGDAKYWERPLDVPLKGKGGSDSLTSKNPSYQIFFYMQYAYAVRWHRVGHPDQREALAPL